MRQLCVLLIMIVFLSGCHAKFAHFRQPLDEEGEVFLYVQPFSEEAEGLRFDLDEVVARRDDGREFPLSLALSGLSMKSMNRQRLVASGVLPPGSYTGLAFKARDAFLLSEGGENSLALNQNFVHADFHFEVRRGRSLVIAGTFRPDIAMKERSGFSPVFSLFQPERPIPALTGYVPNSLSNSVTVFNKKSGQVVDVMATGMGPRGIALDETNQKAYLALSGDDAVDVIDTASSEIVQRILLSTGDRPQEPALTPDGRILVTANKGSDTVSIIDTASFIELERISVGKGPNSVLIDYGGHRAYVFNAYSNTISVIDLGLRTVSATISTDPGPLRGQFNRKGDRLYVIFSLSSYLSVLDSTTLSVVQRISVGSGMTALKIDTQTDRIYLARRLYTTVSVYEPGLDLPSDTIEAGGEVSFIAIDSDENNLYMVVPRERVVTAVNIVSDKTVNTFDVGDGAYSVTVTGER